MQGVVSRIPGRGWDNCFYPWKGLTVLKQGDHCTIQIYRNIESPTGTPQHCSPVPHTLDTPCETEICVSFPLLGLKMSGCKHKTCPLAPLKIKKEENNGFSPASSIFPQQRQILQPLTPWCYVVCWPWHWHSVFGSRVWVPRLSPFKGKLPQLHCHLGLLPLWIAGPLNDLTLHITHAAYLSCPLLKVTFGVVFSLFQVCSPLFSSIPNLALGRSAQCILLLHCHLYTFKKKNVLTKSSTHLWENL